MRVNTMAVFLYIIAMLSMVYGCPPPFNAFKYADNDTLLHQAISQYESNPAFGWAHVIGGNSSAEPWPTNDEGIVFIPYCFTDAWTKSKLEPHLLEAWKRWADKIGSPGAQTGHRLGGFKEVQGTKGPELCFKDKKLKKWNKKLPHDTLTISVNLGTAGSSASMGHIPQSWNSFLARHEMRIGWHNNPRLSHDSDIYRMMHEMGHVLGFGHEHQRLDRDSYVHFQCENILRYNNAVVHLAGYPHLTIAELCTSPMLTRDNPWKALRLPPHEFSTQAGWDAWRSDGVDHKYAYITNKKYDLNSIMHYTSEVMTAPEIESLEVAATVRNVPLVRWKEGKEGFKPPEKATEENAEVIKPDFKRGPSEGDAEGVRDMYPWKGKEGLARPEGGE